MKINKDEFVWVEKYRPRELKDIILPQNIIDTFQQYITDNKIPNLLLTSNNPGLGKTSIAKILAHETNADLMVLNGNLDTGVDLMRTRVMDFCSSANIDDSPKILFIDECLDENEKIKTPSGSVILKDIPEGEFIDCFSLNRDTGKIEVDKACVISSKEDKIFEVTTDDGRKIRVTDNHPFICKNNDGFYIKSLKDGLNEFDEIVDFYELEIDINKNNLVPLHTFISKEQMEKLQQIHPNIDFVIRCAINDFLNKCINYGVKYED